MSYIGQGLPADVFAGFTIDKFTGDGTANKALTLSKAPLGETALLVTIDGVVQEPTDDFTVSGTTLTLVGTAANNSEINVTHLSGTVPNTLASKVDVNGLSDGIILDADADTTISADTDDQIDFKAGGTDRMSVTSSGIDVTGAITASSASSINVTGGSALTLKSTDAGSSAGPVLKLQRDSGTPADADFVGAITYIADNDAGEATDYAKIDLQVDDASDGSEDGQLFLRCMGSGTLSNRMALYGAHTVFNDDSKDVSFRVESDDSNKAFFINGTYGHCHITGASSATKVSYYSGGLGALQLGVGGTILSYDYGVVDGPYILHNEQFDGNVTKYIAAGEAARYGMYDGRFLFYTAGSGSAGATVSQSLRFEIANNGDLTATDTTIGSNSDQRLKENIQDFTYDVSKFKSFKPRTFDWKNPEAHDNEATTGFIAQEVESIDSDWAYEIPWDESKLNNTPKEAEEKALCGGENKKGSKLGKKDAMYISVIQQLITRIEALEDA